MKSKDKCVQNRQVLMKHGAADSAVYEPHPQGSMMIAIEQTLFPVCSQCLLFKRESEQKQPRPRSLKYLLLKLDSVHGICLHSIESLGPVLLTDWCRESLTLTAARAHDSQYSYDLPCKLSTKRDMVKLSNQGLKVHHTVHRHSKMGTSQRKFQATVKEAVDKGVQNML